MVDEVVGHANELRERERRRGGGGGEGVGKGEGEDEAEAEGARGEACSSVRTVRDGVRNGLTLSTIQLPRTRRATLPHALGMVSNRKVRSKSHSITTMIPLTATIAAWRWAMDGGRWRRWRGR